MSEGSYNQFCPVAMAAEILVLALDPRSPARTGRRLDAVQRAETRRAAHVAGAVCRKGSRTSRRRASCRDRQCQANRTCSSTA